MDAHHFDTLTRLFASASSRRTLLPLIGSLLAGGSLAVAKKKKKKKKKITLCHEGQTIKAAKKKKKQLLKRGATAGACPPPLPPPPPPGCTPTCPGTVCGGDDGCGGVCGCAAGSICHSGICQICHVSCPGDGVACGNELQTALTGGGTIRACPGRYIGTFEFVAATTSLIGAGDGEDPATSTILDANSSGRVVRVNQNVNVALHGLRITGGAIGASGGGVLNGGKLTLTRCSVSTNTAIGGGGLLHSSGATGPLALTDCRVTDNTASDNGGGFFSDNTVHPVTLNGCTVSGNTSGDNGGGISKFGTFFINGSEITGNEAKDRGGGIFNLGTVTFDVASRVTGNTAGTDGGGISNDGTVTLNGAEVSGNTPNNCAGTPVNGCVEEP